jgi:hypothetical protein
MQKSLIKIILTSVTLISLLSCQPASVSYIDPNKTNKTQSAQENACTIKRVSGTEVRITCPDGTSEVVKDGVNGVDGINGTNGTNGVNGADGINGTNGTNGANGADGKGVEVIDPCGAESQIGFDEILLRLPDRTIIAYFKFDSYEHLTRLVPGHSYVTTDDTKCEFKIDEDGTIYDARGGKY